jgi:hypothetical protein
MAKQFATWLSYDQTNKNALGHIMRMLKGLKRALKPDLLRAGLDFGLLEGSNSDFAIKSY